MPKRLELRFSKHALSDLLRFIRLYEEAFFELYRDGGVWSEEIIIQGYRESAQRLYLMILGKIESRLAARSVLGRKAFPGGYNEFYCYVGNRLVIVRYSDDATNAIRLVESIAIDRKPIIF